MKNVICMACLATVLGNLFFSPLVMNAAEVNATVSAPVPVPSAQVTVSTAESVRLPPAANEVVKLARAQVSEDVIISYVQNSGATCSLSSDDIVRLRNEGVSDRVINAMLARHSKVIESLPQTPAPAPVYADNSSTVSQPTTTVEAPLAPTSSAYVIPYPAATAAYYGYYRPYYPYSYGYPYYGFYGGPVFSFRFGFGGHGGYGWRGGGWHGGGGHHGHR